MKSERYSFIVEEEMNGQRVDSAVAAFIPEISRSFSAKLIESGALRIDSLPCISKKRKLAAGETVDIEVPLPEPLDVIPEDIPIDIVYEDDDVLVVNKPRGMVVHPAPGNYSGTLVNAVLYHCGSRLSSINGVIRPGIVHRIDKDTSGLLMIAKNNAAHEHLSRQLSEHSVIRRYLALVYDNIATDEGIIDKPIGRDPKNRLRNAVTYRNSKPAVTRYRVLERYGRYTLISCRLETGRTHQIRVHMSYINHPLVGDPLYGPKKTGTVIEGQLLHAGVLGFIHPSTGENMLFETKPPEDFKEALRKLKIDTDIDNIKF